MRRTVMTAAVCCALAGCGGDGAGERVLREGPDFDYMVNVMQPRAEVIWDSAGYIITAEGERDLSPTTDEGWAEVVAGAEAVKQSGEELQTIDFAYDEESWVAFAQGLVVAGERARQGALAQDSEEIFEAGAQLYRVCVACHQFYRTGEFAPAE